MEEYRDQIPAPTPEEPAQACPAPEAGTERITVCDVQFRSGSKTYYFDPGQLELHAGDHVIIDTARGAEYGSCVGAPHRVTHREVVLPLRRVLRIANAIDERIKTENERLEKEAYAFCQRKVEELGLDMQLVSAECAFDGSKLLFYFTADARVDFRELVKILASNFHTRIELRQIGVRDKAKLLGGLGICGRPFCCASFLEDFQPVSIKMAKTQNLSLNPTKISGTCGRLMCCLKYEQDAYEDLIQTSPKAESFVDTPDGRGTVTAVNLMRQSVNVRMENDPEEIRCYKNCDICVLRSGKAKKNDPPIPDDLAPISGARDAAADLLSRADQRLVLAAEEAEPETEPMPEPRPARRQNRDRPAWQEPAEHPAEPESVPEPEKKRENRKRNRDGRKPPRVQEPEVKVPQEAAEKQQKLRQKKPAQNQNRQNRPRQEKKQPAPKPVPAPEQPKAEAQKKNNRRRYYHNRKPKGGGENKG